jgi:glycosyltransferase involved in cell wall biosynthesis
MSRVSVAVPVYNGALLIAESLNCIVNQTMQDFEVIMSDNASTDGTSEICVAFARKDSRFRHVRHDTNVGAVKNFFFVRDQAQAD